MVRLLAILTLCALVGCRYVDVDKGVDGSWHAKYYSYGLFTSLGYLDVEVTTNGAAHLRMNGLDSNVSTNHVTIVDSTGKIIAEITGDIVEKMAK